MNKIEFFERCIKLKDFESLVDFISDDCKTEKDLIDICKNANNITLNMITELIDDAVEYLNKNFAILESAKNIKSSGILSKETKEKLYNFIQDRSNYITIMGYRLRYFIEIIRNELLK